MFFLKMNLIYVINVLYLEIMPPQWDESLFDWREMIEDAIDFEENFAYWKKMDKEDEDDEEFLRYLERDDPEDDNRKEPHKSKIKRSGQYVEVKPHGVLLKKFPNGPREGRKAIAKYRSSKSYKQAKLHLDDGCTIPISCMGTFSLKWMQREHKPLRHKRDNLSKMQRDFSLK
jgi:hypothetical protein